MYFKLLAQDGGLYLTNLCAIFFQTTKKDSHVGKIAVNKYIVYWLIIYSCINSRINIK